MALELRPCPVRRAEEIVGQLHRHLPRIEGGLFATCVYVLGELVGVGVASRPCAQESQDGFTVEITRVATDGHPNACSRLYGALCRAAAAIGHRRAITYTLPHEPGTSLRAAGFVDSGLTRAESWDRLGRPRKKRGDEVLQKRRWTRDLREPRQARLETRREAFGG